MKLPSMVVFMVFVLFVASSALDMSIIGYDDTHMSSTHASAASSWRTDEEINDIYSSWLAKHGKFYRALKEKTKRFKIFKDNLRYIEQHNSHGKSYKLSLNKFADMSAQEYRLLYTGAKKIDSKRKFDSIKSNRYSVHSNDVMPDIVDWRTKGAIAPIKNQGYCGSCWAFSTIGSVEAINQIVTGDLITLSEQELVDCDTYYNQGCYGGYMDYAFEYIINNGGIVSDKDYPYTGRDGRCDVTKNNAKVVSIDGYEEVPINDELALQKAVVNQPVTVAIEAGSRDFQFYDSGIFSGSCGTYLDHGVVVVGYGTEDGKDYWIVRNSWGVEWGEEGYIRMERNIRQKEGKCGIAMEAFYPIKKGLNPPNPGPSPPSPVTPDTFCDKIHRCPASMTCCCTYNYRNLCFAWGCCSSDYPVCNKNRGVCSQGKTSPLETNPLKHILATPANAKRDNA